METNDLSTLNIVTLYELFDDASKDNDIELMLSIFREVKKRGYLFGLTNLPPDYGNY